MFNVEMPPMPLYQEVVQAYEQEDNSDCLYEVLLQSGDDTIEDLIELALSQVGYKEGANNKNKYGEYFDHNNVAWCAYFVSWLARQLNIPESVIPTYAGCGTGWRFFLNRGLADNDPRAGDIIFFQPTKEGRKRGALSAHTGIVYKVDDEYIYTVEGNASSKTDGVYKMKYKKDNKKILGYGHPQYPSKYVNRLDFDCLNKKKKEGQSNGDFYKFKGDYLFNDKLKSE